MKRTLLTYDDLRAGGLPNGLIDNGAFLPATDAAPPKHTLVVELSLLETPIRSDKPMLSERRYANRRADLFPAVSFGLTSEGSDLIPADRDLIRAEAGESYWDITLSPGKVWSEACDRGMSRAVFPFQLSNVLENDTHHGLATFLYDDVSTSPLRFQISVQTKTFVVPETFDAWGVVPFEARPLQSTRAEFSGAAFLQEEKDQLAIRPWAALRDKVPGDLLQALQAGVGHDTEIVSGLVIGDKIFATPCLTRSGPYPFSRGMKFGIWSATKTAFGAVACMHLARNTGEDPRQAFVTDLIDEAQGLDHWAGVTIGDCLNMATGIGTAAPATEGTDIMSDYILSVGQIAGDSLRQASLDHYFSWFLSLSQTDKNHASLACPAYPWGPGEVARYRDQDLYLAGAAMDAWHKQRHGPHARLWHMVRDEVYGPARIHNAVKFETIEHDPDRIVPLTDAGLLLTMDNVARLGMLLHNGGKADRRQLLDESMLEELINPRREKGLPTGLHTADGEIRYHFASWHMPYVSKCGECLLLPTMLGYGGQIIQILPNGMTAFRFAYDTTETEDRYDYLKLARIADAISSF